MVLHLCVAAQSLKEIDEYIQNHTAYLGGDRPNAVDCAIAPRLYHIQVAMKEFKVRHSPWPLILCSIPTWDVATCIADTCTAHLGTMSRL